MGGGAQGLCHAQARNKPLGRGTDRLLQGELARFKAPKSVEFVELPKTSTGKVQKFVLRQKEWAGLNKKVN